MLRTLASHQCGAGSISRPGVIYGLLLVFVPAPRGSLVSPPPHPPPPPPTTKTNINFLNSNSTWKYWMKTRCVDIPLFIYYYLLFIHFVIHLFKYAKKNTPPYKCGGLVVFFVVVVVFFFCTVNSFNLPLQLS